MLNIKTILFFIFASFFFAHAYAQQDADHLTTLLKNMHGMQAHFTQSILDKNGNVMQTNSGKMALQRPNQFRWEVTKPIRQLIVTNGKQLWIYDPDLEQVTIRKLVKAAGETPAMLLSDENLALTHEFSVKPLKKIKAITWYLLIPKDKSSVISQLKLGFKENEIRGMQIEDHLGHLTQIEFSQVKSNKPVEAALFNFKPPAHVDVINETKSSS